ncbi:hypothetical protein B0H14DRAFT_2889828, partial [Mycena olivaceomarginata]
MLPNLNGFSLFGVLGRLVRLAAHAGGWPRAGAGKAACVHYSECSCGVPAQRCVSLDLAEKARKRKVRPTQLQLLEAVGTPEYL